ncbi:MAG: ATP-binding cassette domain-containing protein [Candidatus Acidiferrales bacterium]
MRENLQPLIRAENLVKRYSRPRLSGPKTSVTALDGVSLSINHRKTLALVGESGSGKSTLALCLACLEPVTSGKIVFDGLDLSQLSAKQLRPMRPHIQLVFQDPSVSLNPRFTALEIVAEPWEVQQRYSRREWSNRARTLLERVGLSPDVLERRVSEFSGGQRQRLAIARALALDPELLILDEALSALDCSTQAQIANLLMDLQSSLGLTYLFVTHDFAMAAHLADDIAVMERGRIVECGDSANVLRYPQHAATRSLLAAAPRIAGPALEVRGRV